MKCHEVQLPLAALALQCTGAPCILIASLSSKLDMLLHVLGSNAVSVECEVRLPVMKWNVVGSDRLDVALI